MHSEGEALITPTSVVTHNVILMMFCYSWEPIAVGRPPQRAPGVRYPRDRYLDQGSTTYGKETFALAAQHGVDVMVGFWVQKDNQVPSVYDNFKRSIDPWHTGQAGVPKIAINLQFENAGTTEVGNQITEVRQQIAMPRYFRFVDAAGRKRAPVVFWGPYAITGAHADLGALSQRLQDLRMPVGDTLPFVIWDGALADMWANDTPPKDSLYKYVLRFVDGFYEHGCAIPQVQISMKTEPDWTAFPHYHWEQAFNGTQTVLGATLVMNDRRIQMMNQIRMAHPDVPPYIHIAGTFPQYCRERYTYASTSLAKRQTDFIKDSRVICTDAAQFGRAVRQIRRRSTPITTVETSPDNFTVTEMFSLTSWAEWREGTTFEPVGATIPGYSTALHGVADMAGDQLLPVLNDNLVQYITRG